MACPDQSPPPALRKLYHKTRVLRNTSNRYLLAHTRQPTLCLNVKEECVDWVGSCMILPL